MVRLRVRIEVIDVIDVIDVIEIPPRVMMPAAGFEPSSVLCL